MNQDGVEAKYEITYQQVKNMTVHMGSQDLVFIKKNKLYVADFSDWVNDSDMEQVRQPLTLATVGGDASIASKEKRRVP